MATNRFTESILKELENNEDGSFYVKNNEGFAVLTVFKPGKKGRPVSVRQVVEKLKLFGIENFDQAMIEKIVRSADGKEYKISEWTGGIPEDSKIEVEISNDKMKAYITIHPPKNGGSLYRYEEMLRDIRQQGIVHGIKESNLKEMVKNQSFLSKTLVAEGTPVTPSQNGYIKLLFDTSGQPSLEEDHQGKIDFKNINIIQKVNVGSKIAERIEPVPGKMGQNVMGEIVDTDVEKPANWKIGTNCKLSEDEKFLISEIDGRPFVEKDGSIKVDEVCFLDKVDYSTGNIDFPGTIVIEGPIADNFEITSKGSIIIKKSVGKVFLKAGGDIVLSGGFMGRNGGLIESRSDIYAKFVEQGTMRAGKSIFIETAALHSQLTAGESIYIQTGRGELLGGDIVAGKQISVIKLGAVAETKTNVMVGIAPDIVEEMDRLKEDIAQKTDILKKVEQTMNTLKEKEVKNLLSDEDKEMLKKLSDVQKKYQSLLAHVKNDYTSLISNYEPDENSYVEVEKFIYPKVNVSLGKGKVFNTELKTIEGKRYIYVDTDGNAVASPVPPKNYKKKEGQAEKK
ncbi:MAG: DUF342 domain-containing protein [Leptospiraceae bacterium]|nr:DUF342 domain-containing protein [Leptospiraceae bacterium]MCP5495342.1 DUF342 domain-containing protein [Leptospiraceae bacterium]